MERVCFLARVRLDRLAEYRQRHEHVWPEVLAALAQAGDGDFPPGLGFSPGLGDVRECGTSPRSSR